MILRRATEADLAFVTELQGRPEFLPWIAADTPDALRAALTGPDLTLWMWTGDADAPLGFALLQHPTAKPGRVEIRRLAVSAPGRGHGRAFVAALCDHAFRTLGAHRVFFDVAADNARARRMYDQLGFQHEGTLRQHWLRRTGDWADLAYYGLLRDEWQ